MSNKPSKSLAGLLLTVAFLSIGCVSVRTQSVASEKLLREATSSALTGRRPSEGSTQILRLALLEKLAEREPKRAIRGLVALYDRQWGPAGILGPATAAAELAIIEARRLESEDRDQALGYYLTAAELAQDAALRAARGEISALGPKARFAAELYNHSVGRLVELSQKVDSTEAAPNLPFPMTLTGPLGTYTLELRGDPAPWDPTIFELRPADEIVVRGLRNRHRIHGIGAPLVAARKQLPDRTLPMRGYFESHDNFYPVTAVAHFLDEPAPESVNPGRHRRVVFWLHDPLAGENVEIGGTSVPLEADFTAPLAVLNEAVAPRTKQQDATLRAGRYLEESGLYLLEPFREDKIPLVLVHGLQSSALTWLKMTNDLLGDAELRRRYQIWTFHYPTGLPFSFSAAILRQSLEKTLESFDPNKQNPRLQQMVMVGHSMGGLLVRSQAINSGESLWNAVAKRPFDSVELPESDLYMLRTVFFPRPLPELSRAIFIATPHRGTTLATTVLGRIASSLVRLPESIDLQYQRLNEAGVLKERDKEENPDVIDSLSSDSPLLQAFEGLEVKVPFHTIVGDLFSQDDVISDGFVPIESSRLLGAESEKIIASGHNVHEQPEGIAEVRRILIEHLRKIDSSVANDTP